MNYKKEIVNGIKEALLFSEEERFSEECEKHLTFEDFSDEANKLLEKIVEDFILYKKQEDMNIYMTYTSIGHNIYYTMAGHGVGFWDLKEYEIAKNDGEKLTDYLYDENDFKLEPCIENGKIYL